MSLNDRWADVNETHIGAVFLAGEHAYKLKKPVDMGFLDFTTREARERVCHKEVELNRRLSPDVYLGVADVTGPDGGVCDHLVVMRRMPAGRRLSTVVRTGEPAAEHVHRLAHLLAAFHGKAARGPEIDAEGTAAAVRARWQASFDQVRQFRGAVLDSAEAVEIERLALTFLSGRKALFDQRVANGRIVDGHGDLLADDIFCLDDGPRVLDCLEFDDRLRYVDGLDDVAFLAMDLERLGEPALGESLLDQYTDLAGDPAPPALRHHYLAYRAFVRVKVACLRFAQGDADAAPLARAYAAIASRHLRLADVRLVLVGGLPGSGKTTLAGAIADRLGATVLSSDRVRKELSGLGAEETAAAPYGEGIYDQKHTARTYTELLRRAETLLSLGETVVLDASWTDATRRRSAARIAARTNSRLVPLQCWAPVTTAAARLATRESKLSDATPVVAERMAEQSDAWPDARTVLTAGKPADSVTQALAYVG
ncbi:bifunctional aminoglycoside phosphotransferase/ATP-binding protein [Amycolatopsis magusensis]|uniref:Aminoglycoside phosphotransferase family enzyme/predicted kinase n=1 Tax=Amycolatopsis magusensis TaxID=882444 RepID=A0ABS4PXS2_9PSEU|nr:AAA family ATPase [Amycolatopsis magusensis]MBP2183680.1 aminoglycoside phosphotransferase family enzyme/predicted kinase [Amycolatopsis magusensis]